MPLAADYVIRKMPKRKKQLALDSIARELETPQTGDESERDTEPATRKVTTERVIRSTGIIRQLKDLYSDKCQVCGRAILVGEAQSDSGGVE